MVKRLKFVQTGGLQIINTLPSNSESLDTLNGKVSKALEGLESRLKQMRKEKSKAYRKVAGASRAENIIETAKPSTAENTTDESSTVEKNTETTEEVVENSKADTIVDAKDKKGYLLAAKELLKEIENSEQTKLLYEALKITKKIRMNILKISSLLIR